EMAMPLLQDGVGDYERALEIQTPTLSRLDTHALGELLFGIAEGYSRLGDTAKAQTYFERIKKDLPDSAYAKRADIWFATKTIPADQTHCVGCHVSK
ncbi:MAG TPA: tetratricopeptide repeat protein, partial [Bryobacteraceae bacterium]|nr:tetratricopeptide repeat protein [Bryobacteraceae bacterium]